MFDLYRRGRKEPTNDFFLPIQGYLSKYYSIILTNIKNVKKKKITKLCKLIRGCMSKY